MPMLSLFKLSFSWNVDSELCSLADSSSNSSSKSSDSSDSSANDDNLLRL
jgi:hypothetical protein